MDILLRNQDKLIDFLSKFHNDRQDDEQFNDENAYLIKQIKELKPMPEWRKNQLHQQKRNIIFNIKINFL